MVGDLASIDDAAADSEALAGCERTFMLGNNMEKPVPGHWCWKFSRNGEMLMRTGAWKEETIKGSMLQGLIWSSPTMA